MKQFNQHKHHQIIQFIMELVLIILIKLLLE